MKENITAGAFPNHGGRDKDDGCRLLDILRQFEPEQISFQTNNGFALIIQTNRKQFVK